MGKLPHPDVSAGSAPMTVALDIAAAVALQARGALDRVRDRGWDVRLPLPDGGMAEGDAVVRWAAERSVPAGAPSGAPVLVVGFGARAGHLRLAEIPDPARPGDDLRLARLVSSVARALDDDAIADGLARVAPWSGDTAGTATEMNSRVALVAGIPAGFAPALAAARRDSDLHLVEGGLADIWPALADGHEVLCLGELPLTGLGLTHDARTPDDVASAFAALDRQPANRRDAARRAVAAEVLFNCVPDSDATALADLIDQGLRAIAPPQRRSVSIVITSHNYADFLPAAIASAFNQTVAAHDVVVVDDGSTDGSADLVAATPGIVAVLQPNRGQAAAFNAGFRRAKGDVVLFLDADDRLLPDAVARVGAADLQGVSRLFFRLETIDRYGRPTGLYRPGTEGAPAAAGFLAGAVATHGIFPFVPTSGNAFPRRVLDRLLPMPEADWRICADLWLVLAAAALGEAVELPEVLGQYRVHGANAHFRDLGADLYAQAQHQRRQGIAWRGLLRRLPGGTPAPVAQLLWAGLQRRLVQGTAARGGAAALSEMPRALRAVLGVGPHTWRARLTDAMAPLRAAGRGAAPEANGGRPHAGILGSAGPAGWPRIAAGVGVMLTHPSPASAVLGRGWDRPDGHGARLSASTGTLAFRLADATGHWHLKLAVDLDGADPLYGLQVDLNGTPIETFDVRGAGEIALRLPVTLLPRWGDLIGWPVDTQRRTADGASSPMGLRGAGDQVACLTLRTARGDAGRLRITGLRAAPLTSGRAHAPRLPSGDLLFVATPGAAPAALACLSSGWGWPDARGAPLEGALGGLSLALATGGDHALTLLWADAPHTPRPADRILVRVNDALVQAHVSPDGFGLTVPLPRGTAGADGQVRIGILPFADQQTGSWPNLALRAVRLDSLPLRAAGDAAALFPHRDVPGSALAGTTAVGGAEGLVADGTVARIVGDRFRLPLIVPQAAGPARLEVSVHAPQPVVATFSVGGPPLEAVICGDTTVLLDLPPGPHASFSALTAPDLTARIEDPTRACTLRSLRLVLGAADKTDGAPHGPPTRGEAWDGHGGAGPAALHPLAADHDDWHPHLAEALWLARDSARLLLPPLPTGTVALAVTVLPLHAAGQRVRVDLGDAWAETEGPGPQTLRLPVVPGADAKALRVRCNRLVAGPAVGAGDVGLLGGAVLGICAERAASRPGSGRKSRQKTVPQSDPQSDPEPGTVPTSPSAAPKRTTRRKSSLP